MSQEKVGGGQKASGMESAGTPDVDLAEPVEEPDGVRAHLKAVIHTLEWWRWCLVLVGGICLVGGLVGMIQTGQAAPADTSAADDEFVNILDLPSSASASLLPLQVLEDEEILVDVGGAVLNPGVYSLKKEDRSGAAVAAAGGMRKDAHQGYVKKVFNGAAPMVDGQKIYIPFASEELGSTADSTVLLGSKDSSEVTSATVSINTASIKELDELPGIGTVRAESIAAGRPYNSMDQLVEKNILSDSIYASLNGLISL